MNHPFASTRALFPILSKKVQLSSCSQSALATPVLDAIHAYMASWQEQGMDWPGWMQTVEGAKAAFARLINAHPRDIAVMGSVSDIASSIGSALDFPREKNRIVVSDSDFPSVGHVWLAHQRHGAEVAFVSAGDKTCVELDDYAAQIDAETALVSVSHVSYSNGFVQDIAGIARLAHAQGALVFVDAYQSAGAVHIDVQRDAIDILATGAQKFLLGCPGIAFAYVHPDVAARLRPSNTGWFGRVNPFAFDIRQLDYAEGGTRLSTGTPPMVNAFAARAALDLVNAIGVPHIESYLSHLSEVALTESRRLGLQVASPTDLARKAATTAIRVGERASEIECKLAAQGCIVSARRDLIRVAPHFYNTDAEVVGALRAIAELI